MRFLLNLILITVSFVQMNVSANCRDALSGISTNDNFAAYLNILFEQNYIANPNEYMRTLIKEIEDNKTLSSPFQKKSSDSNDIIQAENFREQIENPELNRAELKKWLAQRLSELEKKIEQKDASKVKTLKPSSEMKFSKINPGRIDKILQQPIDESFELDTPFEMMQTAVTQNMWLKQMGKHPADSKNLGADYPVSKITWWSALVFANRLSKAHGLQPVYDLSQIKDWVGTPEEGTYKPARGENKAKAIRINAENGDLYKAEGYRLPTLEELQLVYFQFDDRTDEQQTQIRGNSILDYAWLKDNSDNALHPVAELLPFMTDGNPIYDLYGNINEWTYSFFDQKRKTHALNPQPDFSQIFSDYVFASGGSFAMGWVPTHRLNINKDNAREARDNIGFRLVRSLPKEKQMEKKP